MRAARFFLPLPALAVLAVSPARAQTQSFNFTSEGYYSADSSGQTPLYAQSATSYVTGTLNNDTEYRSFFSFDLSGLSLTGKRVSAATFTVTRYGYLTDASAPRSTQPLRLYQVTSNANTLKNGGAQAVDAAVFTDLGDGSSYGDFAVSGTGNTTDLLTFTLNAAALTDIGSKAGQTFSLGGVITTASTDFGEAVFRSSNNSNTARLDVTLAAAPEPAPPLSLTLGVLGVGALLWRARRRLSS